MPWQQTTPITERLSVSERCQTRRWSMTERCTRFALSRHTGDIGIRHQRIEPGRPAQHGRHERRPRPHKAAATRPPERNHATQQARFDRCCREYTPERPHEALGQRTPASRSHASPRPMPATLAEPESPGHGLRRRIRHAGTFRFQRRHRFLRDTWLHEWIALEETGEGLWSISFSAGLLARSDERDVTLRG